LQRKDHRFSYRIYEPESEECTPYRELLSAAVGAMRGAYSPYSKFRVGAAVRLADGTIVTGANQENASFPEGLCAERVALYNVGARYPRGIPVAIAIATSRPATPPVAPCGGCRQVMCETEMRFGQALEVVLEEASGHLVVFDRAEDLMPFRFEGTFLKTGDNR
jgi:cytidine deaminase